MRRTAWTLVELLIVIAIIATLIALALPAIQRVRDAAWRTSCSTNLRQIGLALHGFHDSHGTLPPGMSRKSSSYPYLAWSARILPQLEQTALWLKTEQAFSTNPLFHENPPHVGLNTSLRIYLCPTEDHLIGSETPDVTSAATTNYFGVSSGINNYDGVLFPESAVRIGDVKDGASCTLLVGERGMSADGNGEYSLGWWYAGRGQDGDGSADYLLSVRELRTTVRTPTCPEQVYFFTPGSPSNPCDLFHYWSRHFGGSHFLFADGSVHFLDYAADPILPALASRAGNETVEIPD